jgi:hypothetical protein
LSTKDRKILDLEKALVEQDDTSKKNMSVGDSPRGHLKQRGNPHLKPATTPKHAKINHAGA